MKIRSRADGIIELCCSCGACHPSELLTKEAGRDFKDSGTHECCVRGCCQTPSFKKRERQLTGHAQDLGRTE